MSTFPVSRRNLTIASCPSMVANESGVKPYLSRPSTSTFPVSRSNLTIDSCPPSAAHQSGVRPCSS
ncbi:hypothetical protein DER46DRAFT_611541, partial [Fusarium sp. MPI-SDFR-AT-0072]